MSSDRFLWVAESVPALCLPIRFSPSRSSEHQAGVLGETFVLRSSSKGGDTPSSVSWETRSGSAVASPCHTAVFTPSSPSPVVLPGAESGTLLWNVLVVSSGSPCRPLAPGGSLRLSQQGTTGGVNRLGTACRYRSVLWSLHALRQDRVPNTIGDRCVARRCEQRLTTGCRCSHLRATAMVHGPLCSKGGWSPVSLSAVGLVQQRPVPRRPPRTRCCCPCAHRVGHTITPRVLDTTLTTQRQGGLSVRCGPSRMNPSQPQGHGSDMGDEGQCSAAGERGVR